MTFEDLDGKDTRGCSEPNGFVRLTQSSPPTVGVDLSRARSKLRRRCDIPREAPNSSDPSLTLMPPVNPSVPVDELSTSLAQAGHQGTATWTMPEPSPYSGKLQRRYDAH